MRGIIINLNLIIYPNKSNQRFGNSWSRVLRCISGRITINLYLITYPYVF
jgi:hypothetical protein